MKVILFGARGMLGSALRDVFADVDLLALDKEDIDILREEFIHQVVHEQDPDVLINAAAYTDVDGAESHREQAFQLNEHAVRYMVHAANEYGARFVHYSTDYVFPGDKKKGYREDDVPGPAVNTYGESKLAGEEVVRRIARDAVIIRTAWLYGPNGKNFVDTILAAAGEKGELAVVHDQFGSPTFTYDLARATRTVLEDGYASGVYHLINGGVATWYDLAQEAVRLSHADVSIQPVSSDAFPRPAKRPRYSILLNAKGPQLRPWQDALSDYMVNYKAYADT